MDPAHRDRDRLRARLLGPVRAGHERHARRGWASRSGSPTRPSSWPQERTAIEEACPGDIIGVFDPGLFRIGDTLVEGESSRFEGIPRFSPEHFAVVRSKDPLSGSS